MAKESVKAQVSDITEADQITNSSLQKNKNTSAAAGVGGFKK